MDQGTAADGQPWGGNDWLVRYRPQGLDAATWATVGPFVVECAERLGIDMSAGAMRVVRVLARLAAWTVGENLTLEPEVVLDPDTVERFIAVGIADDRSRATYRSVLRRVAPLLTKSAPWEARPTTVARRQVAVPYTADEIDGLRADALAQPTRGKRRAARVLLALGAGAGLDGRWVSRVEAVDVAVQGQGQIVTIRVGAPSGRVVSVLADWQDEVVDLAATAGDEYLVGGRSTTRNRSGALAASLVVGNGHPRFSASRLRSTWLVTHLALGTRLPELARAAGLEGVTVLSDLLAFVPARGGGDASGCPVKPRAPIDACGGRATSETDLQIAARIVDRSGVVAVLAPLMDFEVGRHRTISVRGLLVAGQLNALARHHRAHLVEVARIINSMTDDQRVSLGIVKHDRAQTYDRVDRLFNKLCDVLDAGHSVDGVTVDAKWLANRLATAAVPKEFRISSSVAVDGTDVETWGALHGDATTVQLDGEAAETQLMDDGSVPKAKRPARKAKVLGVGQDGRNQYTVDEDARAGHRSATNSRAAGPYIGFELHLAVQTRDVRWTNGVGNTKLSDEVPGVIMCFSLVPAGTHRGKAIVDDLIAAKRAGEPVDDVVWDPGYSLCKPGTVHHKLAQAGIHQTFQPVTHQRGIRPFSGDGLLIDGQLFSSLLPDELRDLQAPPRGSSEAEKEAYEAKFNLRAQWRMMRHSPPDADGATRWRCPFCSGFLRSRSFPTTMRRAKTVPLVPVDDGCVKCCNGILTAQAVEMAWWQRITYGTTAWRISMGRRQVAESVNAALKGAFTDLGRGFMRVMGVTKMTRHARLHPGSVQPGPHPQFSGQVRPR